LILAFLTFFTVTLFVNSNYTNNFVSKIILTLNSKKMKKVFLTLAVVFATSTVLVSCGGKKEEATGNATEEATSTEEPAAAPAPAPASENASEEAKADAPKADEKKEEKK
jgi:hypothetical protein